MPTDQRARIANALASRPSLAQLGAAVPSRPSLAELGSTSLPTFAPVPPQQISPEMRSAGLDDLKAAMWRRLGVDYSAGPFAGPYDDSQTLQNRTRRLQAGEPDIDMLRQYSDAMERALKYGDPVMPQITGQKI